MKDLRDLKQMVSDMEEAMKKWDLSDSYLCKSDYTTRDMVAYEEQSYGITMVPCSWVYPYLKALAENNRLSDIVKMVQNLSWFDDL